MVILRIPPKPAVLFLPAAVALLSAFTLGVSLLLSSIVVHFPDVIDIYQIGLTAWLYISAIFYPYDVVPIAYRWWFFNLNPMYHMILLFRDPLYFGNWPTWAHIGTASAVAFGTLIAGWIVFTRRADELAYRI
jgi:ABC-type polysaccharide/polyol phosphate export permease